MSTLASVRQSAYSFFEMEFFSCVFDLRAGTKKRPHPRMEHTMDCARTYIVERRIVVVTIMQDLRCPEQIVPPINGVWVDHV